MSLALERVTWSMLTCTLWFSVKQLAPQGFLHFRQTHFQENTGLGFMSMYQKHITHPPRTATALKYTLPSKFCSLNPLLLKIPKNAM